MSSSTAGSVSMRYTLMWDTPMTSATCLMDIFSAIVVVVPLILPISQVFGIDPLHLGMIFLANLELGYLTPPVGMNLFLASYRFDKPLIQVYPFSSRSLERSSPPDSMILPWNITWTNWGLTYFSILW
jgi:TRAP-type C4-dicarboxylate transport system permease large subunit